ncbi:hypothetical protein [Rickettsia endosymbiont of Ixodes scapularis]|uniref:hypothetical protein n=1 Tax=Rickettsia endosymbiont of Ixodes scapularis TaxID=444612 RepID=UPI00059133A2|nr:hypothetical protein [Rickettsia endosymbiont of Ixodes scapularis]
MNNINPVCNFDSKRLTKSIVSCVAKPSIPNCAVKPVIKASTDPCFQKHMAQQTLNDPYYQHMPKNDAAAATIYAAKWG